MKELLTISDLERLSKIKIVCLTAEQWYKEASRIDQTEGKKYYDPSNGYRGSGLAPSANLDYELASATSWIKPGDPSRYTTNVYSCLGGCVINEQGHVRIFHHFGFTPSLAITTQLQAPDLLGGLAGSHENTLITQRDTLNQLGILAVAVTDNGEQFSILYDNKKRLIAYTGGSL